MVALSSATSAPSRRLSRGRWSTLTTVVLLFLQSLQSDAFLLAPHFRHPSPLLLLAAKKGPRRGKKVGGPTYGGKTKKTKRNDKRLNDNNNSKKNKKSLHEKELAKASQKGSVALPSQKTKSPPWQVLSAKEAKRNVQQEKKRRDLAKQGIEMEESTTERKKSLSKALLSDADRQVISWRRFNPATAPCGMTFVGAYLEKRLPPRLGVPEVAFLGRSNVGKSSLLNKLCASALMGGDNDGARVGKTPGATASVNLYTMLGQKSRGGDAKAILGLVDLPGFGYAKLSKTVQEAVQLAAERYLGSREELALGILLVDARRVPSEDDRAVLAALYDLGLPIVVVATKIDKLTKNEVEPAMAKICDRLGLPEGQPLCISSVTGEGTKDLWKIIMEACEVRVDELKEKLQRTGGTTEEGEFETIQLDDEGNPVLPDDNGEELGYEQGYDWVQDSAVMYEYGSKEESENENEGKDDDFYGEDYDEFEYDPQASDSLPSIKDLKRQARQMEKRGEV